MKRADKSGARFALLIGEEELKNSTVVVKDLRTDAEQQTLTLDELTDWLADVAY
ncbi:MAG: His/Gly/Thr/Pro-type tRNA ligase C-terminal domain-containing protein [Venatoribacter sp.]